MKELDVLNIDYVKYGKVGDCLGHIGITIPIEKEFLFREICYYKYNLSDKEKYKIMIIGDSYLDSGSISFSCEIFP